jgi:hypothetical protein
VWNHQIHQNLHQVATIFDPHTHVTPMAASMLVIASRSTLHAVQYWIRPCSGLCTLWQQQRQSKLQRLNHSQPRLKAACQQGCCRRRTISAQVLSIETDVQGLRPQTQVLVQLPRASRRSLPLATCNHIETAHGCAADSPTDCQKYESLLIV